MRSYRRWLTTAGLAVLLLAVLTVLVSTVLLTRPSVPHPKEVEIANLLASPMTYDGKAIRVHGYLVRNIGAFLGDRYALYTSDPVNQHLADNPSVAVGGSSEILDRYTSFSYNGTRFESRSGASPVEVVVEGTFRFRGQIADGSPYYVEVSNVYPLGERQ